MNLENASSLLTRAQAAEYLAIRPQTLAVWATTGRYRLPYVRIGTRAMYRIEDLQRFIESRRITHGEVAPE